MAKQHPRAISKGMHYGNAARYLSNKFIRRNKIHKRKTTQEKRKTLTCQVAD